VTGWTPPPRDPYVDLADAAAHETAVRGRVEQRERRERAAEVATWVGTLRDLAERQIVVNVRARSGRVHRGVLVAVGLDHVALRLSGALVLVALDAVRTLRPEPGALAPPAMGDRASAQDRTLAETFERLVEDRRAVVIVVADVDEPLHGDVVGLGEDVVTLRSSGADRATVYLPLGAIDEVVVGT
jgi:hypothetical protein